jgi:hypothetical protein
MKRALLLAACCSLAGVAAGVAAGADVPFPLTSSRSIDGAGYAIGGVAGTPLIRIAPADFPGDGSGDEIHSEPDAPNPRTISNICVTQPGPLPNERGLSDMIWAWGQFLDHDLDLTLSSAANGTADFPIPDLDDPLGPLPIFFNRSDYAAGTGTSGNPRQQVNAITAFIDGSNVYGSDPVRAAALRTFRGGRLKTSAGNLLPFNVDGLPNAGGPSPDLFLAGDVRANEQVGLTAMHTLFVREHNRLAARIVQVFPHASDEQIYQLARKIVGAELQIITYNEFLPALLGPSAPSLSDYAGWDPLVDPSIANEFSTALFRVGHTMLSPDLLLADSKGVVGELPLRLAFFNPDFLADNPAHVEHLLAGFTRQQAQEIDNFLVDDVRNFLFGPPGAGGLDLASLNIQRGRDHGLPPYNGLRVAYGLAPAHTFREISSQAAVADALAAVYDSPDEVDPWVGALAEDHVPGASVGPLVAAGLIDQFTRLRDGDPYFFLNDRDLAHSRIRTIIDLRDLRLCQVIRWNTKINRLPGNVFFVEE